MKRSAALLTAAALVFAGCGSEGGGARPAPSPAAPEAGTPPDASDDAPDGALPEGAADGPVTPRRSIIQRNPFGNYAATRNLLLDGDFEWFGPLAVQYPWLTEFMGPPEVATGPTCRSGMKCARLAPGAAIAGVGTNPADEGDAVRLDLWVRPLQGDQCPNVTISLENCFLPSDPQAMPGGSKEPGDDGWCRRTGVLAAVDGTPCVFISVQGSMLNSIIVDDVVMAPASSGATLDRVAGYSIAHAAAVSRLRTAALHTVGPPVRPVRAWPVLGGKAR